MSPRRSDGMRGRRLRDGMKAGLIEFPLVRMLAWPIAIASIHFV